MAAALLDTRQDPFEALLGAGRGAGRPDTPTIRFDGQVIPYGLKVNASRTARLVAGQMWGKVQKQVKVADGIYFFSTERHGGIVAVTGVADLQPVNVQAAREAGLTELVVKFGTSKMFSTAAGYKREELEAHAQEDPRAKTAEVWVGEQMSCWAAIFYGREDLLAKLKAKDCIQEYAKMERVEELVREYHEDFLAKLYSDWRIIPDGMLAQDRHERELLDAGEYLRCSASSTTHQGRDVVLVTFRNIADEHLVYRMDRETYRQIPLSTIATVSDYERFGDVEGPLPR